MLTRKRKLLHNWGKEETFSSGGVWMIRDEHGSYLPCSKAPIFVASAAWMRQHAIITHPIPDDTEGYYIVSNGASGPYADIETALTVADTMHTLKEYP